MLRFLLITLLCCPLLSVAQFTYVQDQRIPVRDIEGALIPNAWAGGLNAAQYNTMDLNADGQEDLVLFDRMANKVITFLNVDNSYRYAPEFEKLFPAEITNWMLLRDYNCDGKKDIFTGDILGIKVFTNVTGSGDLSWERYLFYTGPSSRKSEVLVTQGSTSKVNLQLGFDDLPSLTDVDGDGDLDIFNFRYPGGGTLDFHKNLSVEKYGTCDSLDFERINRNWGDFEECQCGTFAFNGQPCNIGGRVKHAGGKSLLVFDANGDAAVDIVMSEAECTNLYLLTNDGTSQQPDINSSSHFPANNPANFYIFPAAYYEDVDFDGVKDLIAAPNIYNKEFINTNLRQSNWFYKNTGTTASPSFSFIKNNFLQDEMIDVGDQAVPALTDYDGDGDLDLFISRSSSDNIASSIFLYENVGSATSPEFKLVTEDYLRLSLHNYYNLKIQFTDINKDNTPDLVFTATSIINGATDLYFVPNQSTEKLNFNGQSVHPIDFILFFTENVYVTDVDADGFADLLVGRNNGSIEYWKNRGTAASPSFTLVEENFLGYESSVVRQNISMTSGDLDSDGKPDLVLGDQTGILSIISDYRNQRAGVQPETHVVFNQRLATYTDQNLGGRIWPVAANLFNTTKPALVVGNIMGGVQILRHDDGFSKSNPVVDVYPNPILKSEILKIRADRPVTVEVFSSLGARLSAPEQILANEVYEFKLPDLAAGIYFLRFRANGKTVAKQLVVR